MDPLLVVLMLGVAAVIAVSRLGRAQGEEAEAPPAVPSKRPARARPDEAGAARPPRRAARARTRRAEPEPRSAPEPEPAAAAPDAPPATPAPEPAPAPKPQVERRKHPRLRSDQTFSVTPFAGRELMAQCRDISLGGMRFALVGYDLREDDLVRVTFNVGEETVSAVGRVVRSRKPDPITSDVSLEFVRIDPWAERLLEEALQAGA